jgi:hypothetical protein
LALAKPVGVSKNFFLLDVPTPSHGPREEGLAMTHAVELAAHVAAFDNLGDDSSPDVHWAPSPKGTREKMFGSSTINI